MPRIKLTDRYVHSINAPVNKRLEISDAICPGLHLRVTPRGIKTFSLVIRRDGLVRKTLGRYPQVSLARARELAMALLRDESWRLAPVDQGVPLTFAGLVDCYTELHLQPNLRSWKNIKACLRQPALAEWRAQSACDITKAQIVAACDGLVAAGTPHAAANLLKSLRAMFNWAVARGELQDNPCDRLRPPVRGKPRERLLSDNEVGRIWQACGVVPEPFGDVVRLLLLTGARRNEVAQMRWSELDGNLWTLPAERSKSGRANTLPLSHAAMAVIARQVRGEYGDFVFSTTGGARPSSDFARRKRLLDQASGVTSWRLHDLRRYCRTSLSQLGVQREVARRILGHAVDQLDATYDRHDFQTEKASALEHLANRLAQLEIATNTSDFVAEDRVKSLRQREVAK